MQQLTLLQQGLGDLKISLPAAIETKLIDFLNLLTKWNAAYNLTAITDPVAMVTQHLLDSLSASPYLSGQNIIDVGSGAGLPGIPLALANPQKQFTLIDSNGKKIRFLHQVIYELSIKNVSIVQQRVEKYAASSCFEIVISRAFASLAAILEQTEHLLCPSGQFLSMKGNLDQEELNAIPTSFTVRDVRKLFVPGLTAARHLIIIERNHSG